MTMHWLMPTPTDVIWGIPLPTICDWISPLLRFMPVMSVILLGATGDGVSNGLPRLVGRQDQEPARMLVGARLKPCGRWDLAQRFADRRDVEPTQRLISRWDREGSGEVGREQQGLVRGWSKLQSGLQEVPWDTKMNGWGEERDIGSQNCSSTLSTQADQTLNFE